MTNVAFKTRKLDDEKIRENTGAVEIDRNDGQKNRKSYRYIRYSFYCRGISYRTGEIKIKGAT